MAIPADLGSPIAYLAVEAGLPVFDSTGAEVGTVDEVVANDSLDIF